MYMDKQVKRGYNEYLRLEEKGYGKKMMDVGLLVMEAGDTISLGRTAKGDGRAGVRRTLHAGMGRAGPRRGPS